MELQFSTRFNECKATVQALSEIKEVIAPVVAEVAKFEGKVLNARLEKAVDNLLQTVGFKGYARLQFYKGEVNGIEVFTYNRSISVNEKTYYADKTSHVITLAVTDRRLVDWGNVESETELITEKIQTYSIQPEKISEVTKNVVTMLDQLEEIIGALNHAERDILKEQLKGKIPVKTISVVRK